MAKQTSGPDPFSVDHRILHLGGTGPERWGNLGAWDDATDYAQAARALATRVIEAAGVRSGDRVVDAGSGWGQQSLELVETHGAAQVVAIDVSQVAIDTLRTAVAERGLGASIDSVRGSATDLSRIATASMDRVIAVDAAYHFDTRAAFLAEARRVLRPGGRIAWTDMVLNVPLEGGLTRNRVRALSRAVGVPPDNLATVDDYLDGIRHAGFEPDEPVWMTSEVLGGFARFSATHAARHLWCTPAGGWPKILASGLGAWLCASTGAIRYGLFSAS
jgi:SAM-dependent methyltransferase